MWICRVNCTVFFTIWLSTLSHFSPHYDFLSIRLKFLPILAHTDWRISPTVLLSSIYSKTILQVNCDPWKIFVKFTQLYNSEKICVHDYRSMSIFLQRCQYLEWMKLDKRSSYLYCLDSNIHCVNFKKPNLAFVFQHVLKSRVM